jgi:cyclophilin family peptidyl-prolyl cis-trans isomerase
MRLLRNLVFLNLLAGALLLRANEQMAEGARPELVEGVYAEFTTPRGNFVVELNYRQAPMTVASFVGRAEGTLAPRNGQPFFTGLKWYRVVPGFVIQSGDPVRSAAAPGAELSDADDAAGHPFTFPDEFVPGLRHATAGVLSMANGGPDTNSSEFFLTLGDCTRLNYLHSVFGQVFTGLDVLAKIQPNDEFTIRIIRVGEAGRAFRADEATFKALVAQAGKYSGTTEPGPTAHFDDPDKLLPVDPPRAKNFNFKLANYERATGVKIAARLFAASPPAEEDKVAGATMRKLSAGLGLERTGILAAHFADDDWRVWIGDDLIPVLLGHPPTPGELGEGGAVHDLKDALITAAVKKGDEAFAAQQKAAAADRPVLPAQQLKLQTDALLDALMLRFENTHKK